MKQHPNAIAHSMMHSPKMAARATGLTIAECKAIRDKSMSRLFAKAQNDPLIDAKNSRLYRTPKRRELDALRVAEMQYEQRARWERERQETEKAQALHDGIRSTLLAAARVARSLGFSVRSSKGRDGRISSYYAKKDGVQWRISDHELPYSPRRDFMAREHGRAYFDGYHANELIIDEPRDRDWIVAALSGE